MQMRWSANYFAACELVPVIDTYHSASPRPVRLFKLSPLHFRGRANCGGLGAEEKLIGRIV